MINNIILASKSGVRKKILDNNGINCELHILGPINENDYLSLIKTKIKNYNLINQIKFHGEIAFGKKLFRFYKESDIFVLPSFTEGFPHVLWEAASFSLPIITTSVGGIPILLENRREAIMVEPGNSLHILDAIKELIQDSDLLNELTFNAYQKSLNYTAERCDNALLKELKRE